MSIQAVVWVIENSQSRLGPRHVMISIANHASREGRNSYPSIPLIAYEARLSVREVRYGIKKNIALGELGVEPEPGPGGTRCFFLPKMSIKPVPEIANFAPHQGHNAGCKKERGGMQNSTAEGVQIPAGGRSDFAPEPKREPSTSESIDKPKSEPSGVTPASEATSPTDSDAHKGKGSSKNGDGLLAILNIDADRVRMKDRAGLNYLVKAFGYEKPPIEADGLVRWLDAKLKWCAGPGLLSYPKVVLARLKQLQRGQFTLGL